MSELSSLYIKVPISKEQLQKFKKSRPVAPALNSNWTNWWDSREMYNKQPLQVVQSYHAESYGQVIEEIIDERFTGAQETYDEQTKTWYFMVLQFSENYHEIIPMISMLKDLANYLEPNAKGLAILYDFMWDRLELMFEVNYQDKEAKLTTAHRIGEVDAQEMEEANRLMESWQQFLASQYD